LAASGNPMVATAKWNIKFDTLSYTKYLLAYGDFKDWMILEKSSLDNELAKGTLGGTPIMIEKSAIS
jgi:hypothetical protein